MRLKNPFHLVALREIPQRYIVSKRGFPCVAHINFIYLSLAFSIFFNVSVIYSQDFEFQMVKSLTYSFMTTKSKRLYIN